ncbi:sensor histidine kinase [Parathalassolituus penaei]|uniref:histidine kinase n=1 Tax=Parathalassolituus penaei TaxID=2997323 RepID=A0A9X3EM73_9GAMM|nr:ATP-binding protein [Parathalassolituus penaei]MCY0966931.1 ATP-binding protein [Parathalassolituus penaei]
MATAMTSRVYQPDSQSLQAILAESILHTGDIPALNDPVLANLAEASQPESLQDAMRLYTEMSRQLSDSCVMLEHQVEQLSGELAQVSAQRMQELAEKEALAHQLQQLLTLLPAAVLVLDSDGMIARANPAAELMLSPLYGHTLCGQRWRDVIRRCFSPRSDDGHEVSLINERRVSLQTTALQQEPGQLVLITDMTETRALQAKLAHHQRLSAMGRMVASLAHQVRTPLSAATLYAGHLARPELDGPSRERFANKLLERLHHLECQVRDMLIFARGDLPRQDECTVSELLEQLAAAMELPLQQHSAECFINDLCSDLTLRCNREALVSSLMNLVNNALEACSDAESPRGPTLLELVVRTTGDMNSPGILLSLSDNGPGLNREQKIRVMEPFTTTKANGTGLGLAVVQAVVRAHGGMMTLADSDLGGLRVNLHLPLTTNVLTRVVPTGGAV